MRERQLKFFQGSLEPQESRKRRFIRIYLDTVVLVTIINVLVLILSFSLGIERGRKIAYLPGAKEVTVDSPNTPQTNTVKKEPAHIQDEETVVEQKEAQSEEKIKPPKEHYGIQVASYAKENIAKSEKKRLESSGFSTILSKQGKYLVIFVSGYQTKKEAEKIKGQLKKRYSDCIVRKL